MAETIDFRTPFSESCFFKSDLARDGAFLVGKTHQHIATTGDRDKYGGVLEYIDDSSLCGIPNTTISLLQSSNKRGNMGTEQDIMLSSHL
jgi:hypothetical protein